MIEPSLVWFRRDLRLDDQPALTAAINHGGPIIPIYVSDDTDQSDWQAGAAGRWWLHHSLGRLNDQLISLGYEAEALLPKAQMVNCYLSLGKSRRKKDAHTRYLRLSGNRA